MLNYHHLLYFREIANHQSISKASQVLHVGQPALSTQLKQLEDFFGEALFTRENRRMTLTEAGKVALGYAEDIYQLGQELKEVMSGKPYSQKPHIRIGSLSSIPKHILIRAVNQAKALADCQFTVVEERNEELLNQLFAHKLDFFISNHNPASDKIIYSRKLAKLPIYLFGDASYKRLAKNFPKSLDGESLILPTKDSKLFHDVEHFLEKNNIHFQTAAVCQDTAVQKLLASEGIGLTPQPRLAVEELLKEKKLFAIGRMPGVYEEFYLITTKRRTHNPVLDQVTQTFCLD
ncbi:MAG: LysR family transcriptional regulator [Bdellovibrionales bacterium]|nr:LysR family transcriptional regulator [Bdellovibrionales bacterium]